MKSTISTLKIIAVLACLTHPSFAGTTHAADFFPLDLWEEMAGWQQNKGAVHGADIKAYSEPMPSNWDKAGVVHTTFPFDVVEELNALGESNWHDFREYSVGIGSTHRKKTKPYWLPEELSTDIASGLVGYAERN